ncbi:tyrosine-protein kinase receptor-like [Daktulosphaira vitifoliae]|uniref:tyrosine-protein kinase receptor-like n=1 Tax=Daktulosphaira vitifoliae TaxID=58002 RepID=UPI0021AB051B|nr:tyrosine-protein kinase receptor-like [Daktulosphaira vitifoliae]XP_050527208.1 tyrosine-protein kinase receptor-like [Daktulosphaira vitifoliae]XP_050527209.1 tyrosine-protein kinase receptor-like [Daktulosphaira vitifoliae]
MTCTANDLCFIQKFKHSQRKTLFLQKRSRWRKGKCTELNFNLSFLFYAWLVHVIPAFANINSDDMSLRTMQRIKSYVDDTCTLDPHCQWTWDPYDNGLRNVSIDEAAAMVPEDYMYPPGNDSEVGLRGNFFFIYGRPDTPNIYLRSPYYIDGIFDNNGCSLSFQMHTNVTMPNQVSVMLRTENYTSLIQDNVENNTPVKWEKKKVLLGRQTRQVIIEIITKPGSHVGIDDIKLENCLPEYIAGITDSGCPTVSHFLCADNTTCIPHHRVCDISPDCPDVTDESESCLKVPPEARCTFESGFCGWQNTSEEMMLTWKLNKGDRQKFTGPKWDNTYQNRSGTYAYVDMSGPTHLGSAARMESVHFHPPPPFISDPESKYYNSCYISFFYHKYGSHSGSLGLYLVETHGEIDRMRRLWWSFGNYGNTWLRTVVYLRNITTSYYLQFEARKFMSQKGDVAIDDIAMSPKCFGLDVPKEELKGYKYEAAGVNDTLLYNVTPLKIPINPDFINKTVYKFNTCGMKGRLGPSNRSCEVAYNNSTVEVNVINDTYMDGVQVWTVPETGVYTIIASGARGGKGADGMGISKAATSIAVVEMPKNLQLYILVGQEGGDACRKTFEKHDGACQREQYFRTGSALRELHDLRLLNGGGGGGGGSFVFTGSHEEGYVPLLIGAGGGGLAHGPFKDDRSQHGNGTNPRLPPITAPSFGENPAGAGGGWAPGNYSEDKKSTGTSVLEGGAIGGLACYKSRGNTKGAGGFGGGGGGCVAGGGGGGYTGGRAWSNSQTNGEGGWSFLPENRHIFYSAVYSGSHYGPGAVTIIPAIVGCGCAYLCVSISKLRNAVVCICPADFKLGADGKTCSYQSSETTKIIFLITGSVFTVVIICIILGVWMYRSYRKRKERKENVNILHNGILNYNMALRNRNGNADINPTYDFNGRTLTTNDLPRISRDELRIQKSIGEGAFGVVYRGYYKKTGSNTEVKVAIKTLQPKKDMTNVDVKFDDDNTPNPELEREKKARQKKAELSCIRDFLTEAIIMSQFDHPNIVKFIGITFEKNYRFIVTELLSGGDLKEFLRKNRPSVQQKDKIIPLKLKDLLKMALDIAKGCMYLENLHFIHRDIAARNCLLSTTGRGRITKIADFGMSRDVYRNEYYRKDGQAMLPIKWMPTESLVDGVFNSKTDIWSYGITFWEIMTYGSMPYTGMTNKETMNYVMRGGRLARPGICPEPVYKLMSSCWKTNPENRPTFEAIRNKLRLFIQDPVILEFKQPVIGRPPAPLPYRTSQPDGDLLNDPISSDNSRFEGDANRNINITNGAIGSVILEGEQQEEPQYVTPLPADDLFEGVDAELMKDAERFGRRDSEPMLIDDGRNYIEDDDDDEEDENVARAFGGDEDPKDDEEEEGEEEEDDDDNGEEIVLEADRKQSDPEEDEEKNQLAGAQANALMVNSNGIPSYNWNRFKETSFISMKEPIQRQSCVDREIGQGKRRKSFSELEDNRAYPYSIAGRVRYNVASDGKIRC